MDLTKHDTVRDRVEVEVCDLVYGTGVFGSRR